MSPKAVNVRVLTMDSELEFAIQPNTTGKQLFDQVVKTIALREIWFFGLQYTDSKDFPCWLKLNKKVLGQDIKKNSPQTLTFKFRARFFPEEVSEELIQEITQKLFFLQVKESILTDEIYCPPETCVLLASYAMQAKHGDFNDESHRPGSLVNERLLPKRVMEQFQLSPEEWEKRVVTWWKEHRGMLKEEAMLEYLKIAQDLEMYGVNYFDIRNKKGTELYLGVDALGLNIYDKQDKLTPKIGFPWSEIRNISFNDKKFVIKPMEKKSPDFIFYAPRLRINRRILSLCMGNHELYMRRRKADSIEVQQMKAQAQEEKMARLQERERIQAEIERRKQAEQEREAMRRKVEDLERSAADARRALEDQSRITKELEEKRKQAEEAQLRLKQEREEAEREHERMMERVRYEQEEKDKIVQEIEQARRLADQKAVEAQQKENEARELEEQLREAKLRVLQAQQHPNNHTNNNHYTEHPGEYGNPMEDEESDEEENNSSRNGRGVELLTNEYASRHEENRTTATTKDHNMKRKLEEERKSLRQQQKKAETREDKIYRDNIFDKGIDRYQTLKKIRQGTVKRRIDEFEAL
ncbi:unnamed protein product [Rotaria magnacalcarata]|uniref:FERM domain-containing protein n=1 Tax=Rotaria magnacalcarata TaxID=392030 RepID=A0A819NB29_9BILA|nr:unnamed protein product [Rotaria magnacalcarata]CAF3819063.1 unnamed protein product [Rotaria magnacalcarata]CAF3830131.1 unnamed protein product [Rotaria magnacalcarata]CAF3888313.1 unnamed protein product [Rotaria magnacalcarata]CAF3995193.1 unnamed protein product [Rotaria magnacalcarata]